MKYAWCAGMLLAVLGTVIAQDSSCYEQGGNWYCHQVQAISYSNFGTAGRYNKVAVMGAESQCVFTDQRYQGGMAPFDGEVSNIMSSCRV